MSFFTPVHNDNGPFSYGVPQKQGWYWFAPTIANHPPVPCKVLHGQGGVLTGVRADGWNRGEIMPFTEQLVATAYYAPMAPPPLASH